MPDYPQKSTIVRRVPRQSDLDYYLEFVAPMELEEFLARWDCTQKELALICGVTIKTVGRWANRQNPVKPTDAQRRLLRAAHRAFLMNRDR